MHVVAYADRVNITFAESELTPTSRSPSTVFGLAAGIFFLSYVVLEIPSNLVLHRVGARRWMGRIMISWGIVAAATAFVWDGASRSWRASCSASARQASSPASST